ncbi:MAG TPA: response regulator [Syntrophomonadaceae bacterium]|nr:response regulator [Syntrophomonadaceae bacterium]
MKILVVDDSLFSQKMLIRLFNQYLPESEVIVASQALEAFELYKKEQPAFVITDLLMPEVSGQELIRLIMDYDSHANIIVISADIQKSTRAEVMASGALAFLNKPLTDEVTGELLTLIKETPHA